MAMKQTKNINIKYVKENNAQNTAIFLITWCEWWRRCWKWRNRIEKSIKSTNILFLQIIINNSIFCFGFYYFKTIELILFLFLQSLQVFRWTAINKQTMCASQIRTPNSIKLKIKIKNIKKSLHFEISDFLKKSHL